MEQESLDLENSNNNNSDNNNSDNNNDNNNDNNIKFKLTELHDLPDHDNLDMSWITDQERLQNIQNNYCREPMSSIDMFFVYINRNNYIDKILCEKTDLSGSYLSKELLLQIIQSKKTISPMSKYKLTDTLLYHVELEPEQIQSYSHGHNDGHNYFKVLPILDDITISPSIFIFHDINAIYFLFQEIELDKHHRHTLKSILKTSTNRSTRSSHNVVDHSIGSQNTTKKVRILYENSVFHNPESKKIRAKMRKTRRHRS